MKRKFNNGTMSEFKKSEPIHITGLTDKGRNDPELAEAFKTMINKASESNNEQAASSAVETIVSSPNEVTMFGVDYDGALSADEDGWHCNQCQCWNREEDMYCRYCDYAEKYLGY